MKFPEEKFSRLTKSIDWSIRQLGLPRSNRVESVKQLVGTHHSEGGAARNLPVNMIKLAHDIYVRSLAARAPRVLVTTTDRSRRAIAASFELALNQIPKEIGLSRTLREVVSEALFGIGVVKIGLHSVGEALGHSYGEPFVDCITFDDYFLDMTAKRLDLIQYEGNDYWLTVDEIRENERFYKEARTDLTAEEDAFIGEQGEERAEGIAVSGNAHAYSGRVPIRDVWLVDEGLLITYLIRSKKILGVVEWNGPKLGPYRKLGYASVPGNLLPLAPVSAWRDLHDISNALFRKMANQADSQKSVLGFSGDNDDEVSAFKGASDGGGIHYAGPEPKKLMAGGVSPNTLAFYQVCRELSSYFGGNLDALGGLAPMTETVGQDKLLTESASAQMRDMSSKTIDFIRSIFEDLAWYEWNDPVRKRMLEKQIPGMREMSIPVVWDSETRQGDFDAFNFDIDVYSSQDDAPSLKLQRLGYIMQTYIAPLAPEIERQGGQIDVQLILDTVFKLSDFEDLKDIVTFVESSQNDASAQAAPGGGAEAVSGPPPGRRPSGSDSDVLQQVLSRGQTLEDV